RGRGRHREGEGEGAVSGSWHLFMVLVSWRQLLLVPLPRRDTARGAGRRPRGERWGRGLGRPVPKPRHCAATRGAGWVVSSVRRAILSATAGRVASMASRSAATTVSIGSPALIAFSSARA